MQEEAQTPLEKRIKELENKVTILTSQIQDALNLNKIDIFKVNSRVEALLRHALFNKSIPVDELYTAIETYDIFRKQIQEIRKIESIPEKIEKAIEYNRANTFYHYSIYADDLELKPIFEKTGGPSSEIALKLLSTFQMSTSLKEYLQKYAKN